MKIRILGAHANQSRDARPISILIDDVLCIDAGSISTALTFDEQKRVRALLLTHRHFDHIQGVPTFAFNTASAGVTDIYSLESVLEELRTHLVNGILYPTFTDRAAERGPSLKLHDIEPLRETDVVGYRVLAVPVRHGVPAVGYQVTSPQGASVFFTGDTQGGLADAWPHVAPDLLIIEVTLPNARRGTAKHLAPADLEQELRAYLELKGSAPPVLAIHMVPWLEEDIRREVAEVAGRLGVDIAFAYEDMVIDL
ncbi:MAG: MBL fold metallo-hydrolase [Dehalococcoidia bacterium]